MRNKKGQSTVEYNILVTAVIGAAIFFLNGEGSLFRTRLNTTMTTMTDQMGTMANRLGKSTPVAPVASGSATPRTSVDPLAGRCTGIQKLDPVTNKCT